MAEAKATPTPSSSSPTKPASTVLVKTVWPVQSFKVEGIPEITVDGAQLNPEQLKVAEEAAGVQKFNLIVESGNGEAK